jgi:hypothetical protein
VGVKLPWPKKGNTALPVIRMRRVPAGVPTLTVWPMRSPSCRSTDEPSAISPTVAGGRPASTVEEVTGPVPGARPIAGMTVAAIVTVPFTPNVTSVMPGTCPVYWANCFGVIVPNWPWNAMSQFWPYRLGVSTRRSRFAPNVIATATAATATARPSMVLRTGTLGRPPPPVPGSSANRTPVAAVTGAPARARRSANRALREDSAAAASAAAGRAPACRHAVTATRASSSATIAAAPAASTPVFTLTPGCGSASRAAPIGVSGDAAIAIATAPMAPARAATATSRALAANSWRRVMPSAARVPLSAAVASTIRTAVWPTMSSAVSARASANSARVTASGRIACSMAAACVASSATKTCPLVSR